MANLPVKLFRTDSFLSMTFKATDLRAIQRAKWINNIFMAQEMFGIFNFMRVTNKGNFQLASISGSPHVWQAGNVCTWNPIVSMDDSSIDIIPTPLKLNDEICMHTANNGIFDLFQNWSAEGTIDPDSQLLQDIAGAIGQGASQGLRLQYLIGGLQDGQTPQGGTSAINIARFNATKNSNTGLFTKLVNDGNHNPGLLVNGDFDVAGNYTGNVIDLFNSLKDAGGSAVQTMVDQGGIYYGEPTMGMAVFYVSPNIFSAAVSQANLAGDAAAQNDPQLRWERYTMANGRSLRLPSVQGVPIVPDPILAAYDSITGVKTNIAVITATGNMQLGSNFAEIDQAAFGQDSQVGLSITQNIRPGESSAVKVHSEALAASAIADTDLFVGTVSVGTPA